MNWNADYKFRLQRRTSYLDALYKYGGNVLITIGGFCLAGTIFLMFLFQYNNMMTQYSSNFIPLYMIYAVHEPFGAKKFGVKDGLLTLALKLDSNFDITTNPAIWWFVFYALQVAHAGALIAVSTVSKAISNLINQPSFTVGALSFAIAPAASDVKPMLTDDAVDMFQEKQKEVEEYTISKLAGRRLSRRTPSPSSESSTMLVYAVPVYVHISPSREKACTPTCASSTLPTMCAPSSECMSACQWSFSS
jgi:hypothetical protein